MEDSEATGLSSEGEEHVYAAAYHIFKVLRASKNLPCDMKSILDDLDTHFSALITFTERMHEGFAEIEERLECAEKEIMAWVSNQSKVWDSSSDEVAGYIRAADEVQSLIQKLRNSSQIRDGKGRKLLSHAQSVLQMAMGRLEEIMIHILVHNKQFFEPEYMSFRSNRENFMCNESYVSAENDTIEGSSRRNNRTISTSFDDYTIDLIKPDAVPILKSIADVALASDYDPELRQSFIRTRKDALDEYLVILLQVENISIEDILKLEWSDLSNKIRRWIWIVKIVIRVYFTSEKQLCDRILGHVGSLSSICFIEITRSSMRGLLSFGEAMAMGPYQPEKLFRLLDMCEALEDLLPVVVALFSEESGLLIGNQFQDLLRRLSESARKTFAEFCNAVKSNISTIPFPGGGIHHLTRYVMNYIRTLSDYGDILRMILRHQDGENSDPVASHIQLVTAILDSNLISKSKLYKNSSLRHIFLMNNFHYIYEKGKSSKLRVVLGDGCIRSFKVKSEQHAMSYERCSWSSILSLLRVDGTLCSKTTIKQRCRNFSSAFEQVYEIQTGWTVPSSELRRGLQASVSEKVVLAYRYFIGKSSCMKDKYNKYTDEDLQNYLSDLFEGLPRCLHQSRRR